MPAAGVPVKRLAIVVVLGACNAVFHLDETKVEIDAQLADSDGDGVADVADNCPLLANDQNDEDGDGIGDLCDNCPLLANKDQAEIGEGAGNRDGIGDLCDPHPTTPGDCLVVFDSFNAPARFAEHWQVETTGTAGIATPRDGDVVLDAPNGTLAIEVRENGAPILGKHDVQLLALFPRDPGGVVFAASNVSMANTGFWCGIGERDISFQVRSDTGMLIGSAVSPLPPALGDDLYVSIETTLADGSPAVVCEGEYGISLREIGVRIDVVATGSPAAIVQSTHAIVTAFTAYRNVGATGVCPTSLFR